MKIGKDRKKYNSRHVYLLHFHDFPLLSTVIFHMSSNKLLLLTVTLEHALNL